MTLVAKQRLRAELRAIRAQAHAAGGDGAAERLAERAVEALPRRPGGVVAGYRPIGSEIDPRPLMRRLAATGMRLALPVVLMKDHPMIFRLWRPEEELVPDAANVPAPAADQPDVKPDLILMPLLGFDRRGGRLGSGRGHYDRTLAGWPRGQRPITVGVAYGQQEAESIPQEPHDVPLDWIATPEKVAAIARAG